MADRISRRYVLALAGYCLCVPLLGRGLLGQDKPAGIEGTWQGTLDVGVAKLRLVIEFSKKEGGGLTGKMDSPDQQAFGLPIDEVTVADRAVRFTLKQIGGSYEGKLSEDGKTIDGKWTQGPLALPLVLKPGEKVAPSKRPQEPKPPFPYREEEVTYENSAGGIKLAGTLTLPKEGGPFPAVLLITGSGPQNRNEELLGHKPFLLWADYLTRRGIAVLRVDDRGVGGTGGKPGESTIEDHVGDALAGVAFLKSRPEIDPRRIGLMGHSEGGLVAPAAAVKSKDVAFIVLLAGTGVTGEQILYLQGDLIAKAAGASAEAIAKNLATQKKLFAIVKAEADNAAALPKLKAAFDEALANLSDAEKKSLEALQKQGEAQVKMLQTPWFRHFLTYDPKPILEKVQCPVLAICGEKDLQVPPKENLSVIEAALKTAGNKDFAIKELPGLNHLLQACTSGAPAEYGQIEETINPAALAVVGEWLARQSAK